MKIDVKVIRELAENIEKYNLQEVTVESEGAKVTLKREVAASETVYVNSAPVTAVSVPKTAAPTVEKVEEKYEAVVSPMMGTFYGAPAPGSPDFVKEGQEVKQGDTLCIVEAMKLMNEIKASRDGKIIKILLEDGASVVKGDKLFLID